MGSGTLLAPETVLFSGSRAGRPMNISPGTKLGPYELLERIGSGGDGRGVSRARYAAESSRCGEGFAGDCWCRSRDAAAV